MFNWQVSDCQTDRPEPMTSSDVDMKSLDESPVKETRTQVEHRLFESMRLRMHHAQGTFVAPVLLSMRTSGPDALKHSILELTWMTICPMRDLEIQPCGHVRFEFDPTREQYDAAYMKKYGLNIDDYIREKSRVSLCSKLEGMTRMWEGCVVDVHKQMKDHKILMNITGRRSYTPLYMFYNDDNAIRFFVKAMFEYRKHFRRTIPITGNFYRVFERGTLDLVVSPYPFKYNRHKAFAFLPAEIKARRVYNLDCGLEFPVPVGAIDSESEMTRDLAKEIAWETGHNPAPPFELVQNPCYWARGMRPPTRPIYSPQDEIHIMLVLFCTLAIPDWLWPSHMCGDVHEFAKLFTRDIVEKIEEAEDRHMTTNADEKHEMTGRWTLHKYPDEAVEERKKKYENETLRELDAIRHLTYYTNVLNLKTYSPEYQRLVDLFATHKLSDETEPLPCTDTKKWIARFTAAAKQAGVVFDPKLLQEKAHEVDICWPITDPRFSRQFDYNLKIRKEDDLAQINFIEKTIPLRKPDDSEAPGNPKS